MPFAINQKVQHRHDPTRKGTVESLGPMYAGEQYYCVFWGGVLGTGNVSELNLREYTPVSRPVDALASGILGGYADLQRIITLQRLMRDAPLKNNVYAFNASRTQLFPYQFKPLLKFLASPINRLLICDEVGLGKTIEAGLILIELRARQTLRRVLVICPSNLRNKWRAELRNRFGEEFRILTAADVLSFLDEYAENPEQARISGIASLETLRTERVRHRLEEVEPSFDLLIIDEAHHLRNFHTVQRQVATKLCAAAQAIVMLTATPIHLGDENLYSLLNLLDDQSFPTLDLARTRFDENEWIVRAQSALHRRPPDLSDATANLAKAETLGWEARRTTIRSVRVLIDTLHQRHTGDPNPVSRSTLLDLQRDVSDLNLLGSILTRTRKRDVQIDAPVRRAQSVALTFNDAEQAFYNTASEAIRKEAEQLTGAEGTYAFSLLMPQRRLASSIAGMVDFYREQNEKAGDAEPDESASEDSLESLVVRAADVTGKTSAELRRTLAALAQRWSDETPDSKFDAFTKLLRDLLTSGRRRKVVVFATFKHTLRYLERRLTKTGIGVVCISGDVTEMDERTRLIDRFRDDDTIEILLSSRVGTEGLDFQFCSVLVNYDLPWNPMEVEQRIGRIDRIGQEADSILICNLWIAGTIEQRILERLYDRIGLFSRSIGELETILGDIVGALELELLTADLRPNEATFESERIRDVIEARAKEIESLERSAAQFVGTDAFFDDEVTAIRTQRRYVTGEQLRRFVAEFLRLKAPRARLDYDESTQRGSFTPDAEVLRMLRRSAKQGEAIAILAAADSGVAVTFDAQAAYRHPRMEFINALHPLVTAIVSSYLAEPPAATAQHVRLSTAKLPPGFYFYFVYRAQLTSARSFSSLEATFLTADLRIVADGDSAEELLGELVERGESGVESVEFSPELARKAAETAEMAFLGRLGALLENERHLNDAFIEERTESVTRFHTKAIERAQARLTVAERERKREQYRRMLRGEIANRRSKLTRDVEELAQNSTVASDHVSISAGILEVV